jgi:hypothetical protein
LVNSVRRGGQEVATEAEQVPVAGAETGDGPATHLLDLMRDRDA